MLSWHINTGRTITRHDPLTDLGLPIWPATHKGDVVFWRRDDAGPSIEVRCTSDGPADVANWLRDLADAVEALEP